jgi:hypothetical protein
MECGISKLSNTFYIFIKRVIEFNSILVRKKIKQKFHAQMECGISKLSNTFYTNL